MAASPTGEASFTPKELYESLVKWLGNTLSIGGVPDYDPEALSDGNTVADVLVQLAPQYFNPEWRQKIIVETGGNWKLKHNNLKKIHKGIVSYYTDVLHISLDNFNFPDLTKIAEHDSRPDTAQLLQLLLGIAINCDHKDTYIQAIMAMQQEVQHVVMAAIQDLMTHESPSMVTGEDYQQLAEEHRRTLEQLRNLRVENEKLLQGTHELSGQLKTLTEELSVASSEADTLRQSLREAQTSAGISSGAKVPQLQRQLDATKAERLQLESERDDLKHHVEEIEAKVLEVNQRNLELLHENEEIPILRDSLEEMKYLESKVKNYEAVISQYKKKLEDAQGLRKQLKSLEDKNMTYMQQNLDLEEELRRQGGLRAQVNTQRQKVQELENGLAQERLRLLEASQDNEDKQQLIESLRMELAQAKRDQDRLALSGSGESLDMLHMAHAKAHTHTGLDSPDAGGHSLGLLEAFTPELREKMVRLEKENQILLRRIEREVEATPTIPGAPQEESLRKKIAQLSDRNQRLEIDVEENKAKVARLEEVRKTKDADIEKYKRFLNKAKKIIESFGEGTSRAAEDNMEIQSLRNQLKDKEKVVERLEKEYSQDRQAWEREEKLVVSAWYEMGLMMHRKHSQERLLSKHGSFLSQQRQALYKKPVPINSSMSISPASTVGDSSH